MTKPIEAGYEQEREEVKKTAKDKQGKKSKSLDKQAKHKGSGVAELKSKIKKLEALVAKREKTIEPKKIS
jgi:hypothetical protein